MKLLTEYLERAVSLERMAADEPDSTFRTQLLVQAAGYPIPIYVTVRKMNSSAEHVTMGGTKSSHDFVHLNPRGYTEPKLPVRHVIVILPFDGVNR